ncbi:MAG: 16S rRNA (cytosine(967)-C(5))-methyltransferase RsmB, partial [Alicyclobacillus sp.]|nr:16S rRNA (cytosine(967)-C(5))-methyltransferase RsmB [Alicyclobacillus sp.]
PDIRWRRRPEDVELLTDLQSELLDAALRLAKPGGIVVYSTCTLLPEENEGVLARAEEAGPVRFEREDIRLDLPAPVRDDAGRDGLWLTPERFGTDGFFMARLRRLSDPHDVRR